MSLLRQIRRFGTLYYDGGLANQPYITMLELNACIDAEIEHVERKAINERLKAMYAKRLQQEESQQALG